MDRALSAFGLRGTSELWYSFSDSSNSTDHGLPTYSGFIFLLGSSFFYGSNYLPVKQYDTGDGLFFQLILCVAIWTVGFVVNCVRNFPKFEALPLLGGFIWCTGNVNTVPIIRCIGMGMGIIFWGTISLITGWATARFGWFGLEPEVPSNVTLNYIGVALSLASAFFYVFVKSDTSHKPSSSEQARIDANESTNTSEIGVQSDEENLIESETNQTSEDFFDRLGTGKKRVIGISLAVLSGIMYGECFTPVIYTAELDKNKNYIDYLFSFYTGILITSIFYFVLYSAIKKNQPVINPRLVLPGMVSGWMWGIANVCFFLATGVLSQAISFPISNCGPPIFSILWGIFLFKEIRGKKNFAFLLSGFVVAISASVLVGVSSKN